MAIVCSMYHASGKFMYKGGVFVTEASDLGGGRDFDARVYDDACDTGFWIRSDTTGKSVLFALHDVKKDREGDVMSWEYRAITKGYEHLRATVFND